MCIRDRLNRGHHLYSARRPSRTSAHILVVVLLVDTEIDKYDASEVPCGSWCSSTELVGWVELSVLWHDWLANRKAIQPGKSHCRYVPNVAAWLSGSTLILINEITLSLVTTGMGDCLWVDVDRPPYFVTSHSSQLSLLPSAGWKMSTGQSVMMLCSCWGA